MPPPRIAPCPTIDIAETRNTSSPPPESDAIVSVNVVEVAEPIRLLRTNTHIESAEVAFVDASAVQFV